MRAKTTPRGLQLSTRHYQNWGTYSIFSSFVSDALGRRTEVEMRKKSLDHEIHWYMVDVLMTFFSDTKTKEIFIESWWPGPGDWRVGLDYNLSLRRSSCMICLALHSLTLKLCHLDLEVEAHFSRRFLHSISFWASCDVIWLTVEVMGYIPPMVSIHSIKSYALYDNYVDIF